MNGDVIVDHRTVATLNWIDLQDLERMVLQVLNVPAKNVVRFALKLRR